jgi:hypothetical protein
VVARHDLYDEEYLTFRQQILRRLSGFAAGESPPIDRKDPLVFEEFSELVDA